MGSVPSSGLWEIRQPNPKLRHNRYPMLVKHRFPVKGGHDLSRHEVIAFHQALKTRMMRKMLDILAGSTATPINENTCESGARS